MTASYKSPLGSATKDAWRSKVQNSTMSDDKTQENHCCSFCGSHIKEYNSETSLHGPKYITEDGNHMFERISWCIVVLLAITFGVYLTTNIIINWHDNPIITSIDDTHFTLNNIEFPAVTICPVNKAIVGKLVSEVCRRNFTDKLRPGDSLTTILQQSINPLLGINTDNTNLSYYYDAFQFDTATIVALLKKISPTCKDYLSKCRWNGKTTDCGELFRVVSTDDGFCCSFNAVSAKQSLAAVGSAEDTDINDFSSDDYDGDYDYVDITTSTCPTTPLVTEQWQPECDKIADQAATATTTPPPTVVKKKKPKETEIKMAEGPGSDLGLSVTVDGMPCAWLSTASFKGSRFYVHNPSAFPAVGSKGMAIGPDTESFAAVTAALTESTEKTKSYSSDKRKCYFPSERTLVYYNRYSRSNCELETKIKVYEEVCDCRPYYLPGKNKMCNATGMECISSEKVHDRLHGKSSTDSCPPACTETVYETAMSTVPLKETNNGESVLRVFFKHSSVVKYKRDELYSFEDIISNIGGSLGLCMGFSLVSGIELLYFFTCRYCFRKRK